MKSAIFTRAHALTRATIQPGDDYRVTFAAALRIAYAEAATSAAAEWAAKTPEEQYSALVAMSWHEYGKRDARSMLRDGVRVPLPNVWTWVSDPARDVVMIACDAYEYLARYLETRPEWTLSRCLSRAIIQAAQSVDRNEHRNPNGRRVKRDADGAPVINPAADPDRPDAELYLYEIQTDSPTAAPLPQPESMAIARDAISRAAKDDIDRAIMDALARGYSAREIAPRVGMSHTAVNKRISKLRQRYTAEA